MGSSSHEGEQLGERTGFKSPLLSRISGTQLSSDHVIRMEEKQGLELSSGATVAGPEGVPLLLLQRLLGLTTWPWPLSTWGASSFPALGVGVCRKSSYSKLDGVAFYLHALKIRSVQYQFCPDRHSKVGGAVEVGSGALC